MGKFSSKLDNGSFLSEKDAKINSLDHHLSIEMEKFRSRMLLCSEILQSMRQSDNVEEILKVVTIKLRNLVNAVHVSVYKLDKSPNNRIKKKISGKIVAEATAPYCEPCSQVHIEKILRAEYKWGQNVAGQIIDLYTAGMTRCEINLAEIFASKAYLLVPIVLSENNQENPLWGFLTVHQCTALGGASFQSSWDQDDVLMLQQIAMQLEITLQREIRSTSLQKQVKEAEQAYSTLYRWMEQYRYLVEQIPSVSYISPISDTTEFAYISPQFYTLLGVPPSEWNANFFNTWAEYVHPDDRDRVQQEVRHTIETGEPLCCEYRFVKGDGTIIWVSDNARLGLANDGKTQILHGSAFDISDRKRTEQALIKSEAMLSKAQKIAKLGNWEWNILDDEPIWSDELFHIFGRDLSLGTPNYQEIPEYYSENDREKLIQAVQRAISQGESYHLELRLAKPRPDGSYCYIEAIGHAEYDANGKVNRLYGTAQDISDHKSAKSKLLQNETLLNLTIENAPVGIATFDLQGRFLTVNQSFCQIFGYTSQELLNITKFELTHPNSVEKTLTALHILTNHETTSIKVEKQYIHKDSHTIDVVSRYGLLKDEHGRPIQFVAVVEDLTERKQTEAKLASAQIAESNNQAKSEFLAVMSHELRTPMNAVIGMTEILENTPLSRQQQQCLSTIRQGGEVLLSVINNILDFSRIESGRFELDEHPFQLQKCIEEVLELLASRTADNFLELTALISPDIPQQLIGDYPRLRQILVNLVSNAIKFTESGEIVLTVNSQLIDRDTHTYKLQFEVRDTGIGIAPESISKLFKAFSQADNSITRQYGGTGLGLAICKQLCELMGGEIGVTSTVGEGSTFKFSIQAQAIIEDLEATIAIAPELKGKRILSINTNSTLQQAIALYTQPWGITIQAAYSATDVLQFLTTSNFDAILIDRHPLESDGSPIDTLALAQNIQEIFPDLPLILITPISKIFNENNNTSLVCFRDSITKPISASKLYQAFFNTFISKQNITRSYDTSLQPLEENEQILGDENFAKCYPFKILVVEDNPVNQRILLLMLENLGYKVEAVENGQRAVSTFSSKVFDVIFMDLQMPIMNGLIATENIRQLPTAQPWIIGLSANAFTESCDTALSVGMNDYLTKPLQTKSLIAALQRIPHDQYIAVDHFQSPIDLSALASLEDSVGTENLYELINVYLEHSEQAIIKMKEAFTNKDFVTVEAENHALKGGSATFGAIKLSDFCRALQSICKVQIKSTEHRIEDIDKIANLLDNIEQEYRYVYQTFQSRGSGSLML